MSEKRSFFAELKRRHVDKVALVYAVVAWLLIEVAWILLPTFDAPAWVMEAFVVSLVLGFILAFIISWSFEMTPEGMKRTADVTPGEVLPYWSKRKFATFVIGVAVIAFGLLAYQSLRFTDGHQVAGHRTDKIVIQGNPAGTQTVDAQPDGTVRSEYSYNDRGRGDHITASWKLDGAGVPIEYDGHGNDYMKAPIEEHFRPLVDYAARKLTPTAETKGMVVVAPTPGQMMKLLEEKRVDFYMESPYATYLINRLGAAKLLLRRWKGGLAEYRSLIFTNKESGIVRLEDLRGKIIAFEDPGSTSGYFLPKLFLLKKGFSVVEKPSAGAKVSDREIGYIFADTYQNIASLVVQNKVAAGAISNDDYASVDDTSKASISILGESESVPRHLVSVRKDLPEPVAKHLKEILLGMHQNDEGKTILRQTDGTTQFDLLPGGEESVRRKLVELYRTRRGK